MTRRLQRLPSALTAIPGWDVHAAARRRDRLLGLARSPAPPARTGLLLTRTRSIHTFGMRFALDLLWLDADGCVVRVDRAVVRRRVAGCREAVAVVEVSAGSAGAVRAGDRLLAG
jgi:uncharacterized membrane protein (UPF0127 family)